MKELQIRFIPQADITPALHREIDELDRLAFSDEHPDADPEFSTIQWATPDWMGLGFLQGMIVTQLCLPKREILVDDEKVRVAGVGGMATHPDFQHQGLGSALLKSTEIFMRADLWMPFGLLICADETRPFYERSRWQFASDFLYYNQQSQRRLLKTCVMILQLTDRVWPAGEIDLCGLPW